MGEIWVSIGDMLLPCPYVWLLFIWDGACSHPFQSSATQQREGISWSKILLKQHSTALCVLVFWPAGIPAAAFLCFQLSNADALSQNLILSLCCVNCTPNAHRGIFGAFQVNVQANSFWGYRSGWTSGPMLPLPTWNRSFCFYSISPGCKLHVLGRY